MIGRKVQDDDKCHSAFAGHVLEKGFQSREAARRCTYANHWEPQVARQNAFSLRQ